MKHLPKYILTRVIYAVFTLWVVVTITFVIMKAIPGKPFASEGKISPQAYQNLLHYYKLDRSYPEQYLGYLKSIVTLDFGPSLRSSTIDANYYIQKGLPVSMQLGVQALIVSLGMGLVLGIVASLYHNKAPDYIAIIIAIIGVSVPSFIMAKVLTTIFSVGLHWFPVAGWKSFEYTILPTFALAFLPMAQIARLMRSSMLEVMGMDYIKTAKAKGLRRFSIIIKHAIRNAILPIVSISGTIITNLLTGSFVVERIFTIPGMGESFVKSIGNRDYPVIMAATVVYCFVLIFFTLVVDLLYPLIDPRIKLVGGGKMANGK